VVERTVSRALAGFALAALTACGGASAPAATAQPLAATPAASPSRAGPAAGAVRIEGTVTGAAADKITLGDGTSFALTPTTRVLRQLTITPADLRPGMYVAVTAKSQPDGTLLASIVSVFSESVSRAVAGGQRPLPEGNLMTNATIDQVAGRTFTVTFPGGGARIAIAPDAQLIQQLDATASDVRAGAKISASVANGLALSVLLQ
jgi:hypothetical protein